MYNTVKSTIWISLKDIIFDYPLHTLRNVWSKQIRKLSGPFLSTFLIMSTYFSYVLSHNW